MRFSVEKSLCVVARRRPLRAGGLSEAAAADVGFVLCALSSRNFLKWFTDDLSRSDIGLAVKWNGVSLLGA